MSHEDSCGGGSGLVRPLPPDRAENHPSAVMPTEVRTEGNNHQHVDGLTGCQALL